MGQNTVKSIFQLVNDSFINHECTECKIHLQNTVFCVLLGSNTCQDFAILCCTKKHAITPKYYSDTKFAVFDCI